MKTRKTLVKRIKITKGGKIIKKQNRTGHLKRKWSTKKRHRKTKTEVFDTTGYTKTIKRLLGKAGKDIKR